VKQANGSAVLGWVKFAIQKTDNDQTHVTAQLIGAEYHAIKRKVDAGDGWIGEEWVNVPFKSKEIAPELEQYYQAMMQAIRQKWPQRTKKAPGRHKMKCNAWAEEQAREGRTLDEILPEWCDRYKEENGAAAFTLLDDPRKSCAEAMRGANKK
jgi:hypothetical protein